MSFEDAVLMDCIATPYHGIRVSDFQMGDNVVVSGAGIIGLALIQLLKIGGARHVSAGLGQSLARCARTAWAR